MAEEVYQDVGTDKKFRSRKKTNWKWVLKNKKGNILDSTYVVFITETQELLAITNDNKVITNDRREPFVPFKWASIVTKDRPDAHIVELYYKGKIKATALVSSAR